MGVSDPLADMFTVMRNASRAGLDKAEFPSSKFKLEVLSVLKREGFIKNYKHISDNKQGVIRLYLKYNKERQPTITDIKRVSRPGLRVYAKKRQIPRVLRGMGLAIISTSCGVISDTEARNQKLGGEVICYVW